MEQAIISGIAFNRDEAKITLRVHEAVVSPEGTGGRAQLPGIRVAGKTGTAQKWDADAGRYSEQRFRAWFVGIVPAEAPRLVIVAGLDEPRRPQHTGGASAAPLFARVAEAHLARFGILPEPTPERPVTRLVRAEPAPAPAAPPVAAPRRAPQTASVASPPPRPAASRSPEPGPAPVATFVSFRGRVLLPDFSGLSRREVMQITDESGIRARFSGEGRATHQSPPPGTVLPAGGTVFIELSEAASGDRATRPVRAIGGPA